VLLDGYIRVSQVAGRSGERFISAAVQRQQIEGWVAARGHLLGEVFEELDESGAREDRPLLQAVVERVERGDSQGIVVAKVDRFGRSLAQGLAAIDKVTRAGGMFASAQDGLDVSTDTGRLVLRIMLSMGEWELDRIRASWDVACAQATARGLRIGPAPFGYVRRNDGRLTPNPALAPTVAELFRRRAAGASVGELRRYLSDEGIAPPRGGRWEWSTVRGVLRNRTYLGELHYGRHARESAHPALIDEPTWLAAQSPVERLPGRDRRSPALLRGLLRCAGCGRLMTTTTVRVGPGRTIQYNCRTDWPPCPMRASIRDSSVEPYLEALFWQELPRLRRSGGAGRVHKLEGELARHQRDLALYRDNAGVISTLGVERYTEGLGVRLRRLERVQLMLSRARRACDTSDLPSPNELRERWAELTIGERRALLRQVFDCVFVRRRQPIERRLHVCLRGTGPEHLPAARSLKLERANSLDLAALPPSPTLHGSSQRPWPERRLRAVLGPLVEGRERWPQFPDFQRAGLGLAYRQVEIWGGARRWASEYGLIYEEYARPVRGWSEERVRRELASYLESCAGFPTAKQFHADGHWELQRAISSFGGTERWAAEFGRELRWRQRDRIGWSEERIEAALRQLSTPSGVMPTRREMRTSGLRGLANAVGPASERERWASRLGLRMPPRTRQPTSRWSEQAIERALRDLLRGRRVYPTRSEFRAAGLDHVYQAIGRRPGGHTGWAERHQLARPPTARPRRVAEAV
jgi:DNA invertase Pin-like site-specific DNA recombinase